MSYAAIFCTLAICLILGGLSVAFGHNKNLLAFCMRILAPISSLVLCLVAANLSASFGGYTIFIAIALAFVLAEEAFRLARNSSHEKVDVLFGGITNALSILCFIVAGITLAEFNILGLGFGLLLGLGISCIILLVKKQSPVENIMSCVNITLSTLFLGQAIALLVMHYNIAISIMYLIATLCNLFYLLYSAFATSNRVTYIVTQTAKLLSLILLAFSIFFMI